MKEIDRKTGGNVWMIRKRENTKRKRGNKEGEEKMLLLERGNPYTHREKIRRGNKEKRKCVSE